MRGKVVFQKGVKGQIFFNGEVEEQFFLRIEWEDGSVQKGYLARRIWWEKGEKCVEHWVELNDKEK